MLSVLSTLIDFESWTSNEPVPAAPKFSRGLGISTDARSAAPVFDQFHKLDKMNRNPATFFTLLTHLCQRNSVLY